ncbi:LCP family protein [Frankia sp. CNm7]|uniref:LCP family glycopolymer transferase n=1 Tax=Frankia nepalensis TaxID=1836974 RepID=UPI001931F5DC|nr:LCP family protein [Frankia nepalensis]MBL7521959.1 LCP family protein [Frankia nepalensis]
MTDAPALSGDAGTPVADAEPTLEVDRPSGADPREARAAAGRARRPLRGRATATPRPAPPAGPGDGAARVGTPREAATDDEAPRARASRRDGVGQDETSGATVPAGDARSNDARSGDTRSGDVAPGDAAPADDEAPVPAGPRARLSPRARLERLAGGPGEEPGPAVPTRAGGAPVDAPATTALPRPRRPRGADEPAGPARSDEPVGDLEVAATAGGGPDQVAEPADARDDDTPTTAMPVDGAHDLPPEMSPRVDEPRSRRRGLLGVLALALAAMVSCALFLVIGVGYGATRYYDAQVDRTDLDSGDVEGTRPPRIAHGRETWLLVGSDVRTGSEAAEVGGARSDSMMIAYLGSNGHTTLVSIPRDLKVTVPAYTDAKGKRHSARTDKINAAFNLGGPALLLRTLENVADVRIDHFAEIDFNGFRQMSSTLGGVEVCLVKDSFREYVSENGRRSTNLDDPMSGFRGQEGVNILEGDNALAFVRQRHGLASGDYARIQRQQAFLAAVFRKVKSGDLLVNPGKLTGFLNAVTGSVVVDSETDLNDLKVLAQRMQGMSAGQVEFTTIPLSGSVSSPVYYALYNPAMVRAFFQQIVAEDDGAGATAGAPSTGAPPASAGPSVSPTPTVAPSEIKVRVLNGTSTGGAAKTVANRLRAAGYQVTGYDVADDRDVTRTEVRFGASDSAAATRLVADVSGARAVPDHSGTDPGVITLVVGADLVDGETTVVASPTAKPADGAASPKPYYTQAPVSAVGGCIK